MPAFDVTIDNFPASQPVSGNVGITSSVALPLFRDSVVTAQVSSTVAAPGAGAVIATVTPGTAGLWEVTVLFSLAGTTVAVADSNNMALYQTATARLSPISYVVATAGSTFQSSVPPVVLSLSAADTVNVKAIGAATATASYTVTIVARRVG